MRKNRFETLIREVIEGLPLNIKEAMVNVAFVINPSASPPSLRPSRKVSEDKARLRRAKEISIRAGETLLGLYEGVPKTERGGNYSGVLPDKITIFQKPIEELAGGNEKALKKLVYEVVWHEIGHHLGFEESGLRAIEAKKKIKRK